MSVPKVKCPSCGSEWAGPVVFCGECGAPISAPADRAARVPPAPVAGGAAKGAGNTRPSAGARPLDVRPQGGDGRRDRPTEPESRRTVLGMPVPGAGAPAPESVRSGRKRGRKSSVNLPAAPSAQEETEKLLEALDAGFDSISRPAEVEAPPIAPAPEPAVIEPAGAEDAPEPEIVIEAAPMLDEEARRAQHEADMAEVRALFAEMAAFHARPLRDFMIEVSWGDPTREWLDVAVPAAAGLRRAADVLEMADLGSALDGFSAALDLAVGEIAITREVKELLLGAYARLAELMPVAFALEGERGRREPVIVRSLLLQVPGVGKVALDKIYAAGLTSLEMLYAAGPRELAETTGLDVEVAARIHERFQRYRREVAELDPGRDRAAERGELSVLLGELMAAHAEHERVAAAWSKDAAVVRARARKERNEVMLRVNVLLARMGEVERQKALEKAPFAQKIQMLESFLDEAEQRASRS